MCIFAFHPPNKTGALPLMIPFSFQCLGPRHAAESDDDHGHTFDPANLIFHVHDSLNVLVVLPCMSNVIVSAIWFIILL